MSKTLEQRLSDINVVLSGVKSAIIRHPGRLSVDVTNEINRIIAHQGDIDYWLSLLRARASAKSLIENLETQVDGNGEVHLLHGQPTIPFAHVRLLGVQSYIATTWALADRLTGFAGRMICSAVYGLNEDKQAKLVSHFIQSDRKKAATSPVHDTIRHEFGWPIGISYAIRNHVVHDGAQHCGVEFFEGNNSVDAFRISDKGWSRIEDVTKTTYLIDPANHRNRHLWPASPKDDLRKVLFASEFDIDEALGILTGSACHFLRSHIVFMLGED